MTNPRRLLLVALLILVLPLAAAHVLFYIFLSRTIALPTYEEVDVRYLSDQNWTDDERQWFYHETQGGAFELIIDYDWLLALEQPALPLFLVGPVPKLMADDYIGRFGFLPNPRTRYDPANVELDWALESDLEKARGAQNNPERLPVGFARDSAYVLPSTGRQYDVMGFTCAACHTGQINFEGTGIRIDGGPAMTNLTKFELATGYALALTYYIPTRFDRFADAVLGEAHTAAQRDTLRTEIKRLIEEGKALQQLVTDRRIYSTMDGFGRLDALGRIGNFVFGEEIDLGDFSVSNAPVSYPPIWDTPWFEWVQYNASIKRPMIRNAGEAMGVFARVNFQDVDDEDELFSSTIRLGNLHEIESLIRGDAPFEGLRAPAWPDDVMPPIDRARAARGAELYRQHCQPCHLPAPTAGSPLFTDTTYWTPEDEYGNRYLALNLINIGEVGTDSLQAVNFLQRIVDVGPLGEKYRGSLSDGGGRLLTAGEALPFLVENAVRKGYDELGLSDSLRNVWNGLRPNDIRAPLAYKARPLDGAWATAPYLHNGSVPNLYQLLSPWEERDETFYVGSREFDPVHVGLKTVKAKGTFKMDTTLPGNSNRGHQFEGDFNPSTVTWWKLDKGIIGPTLSQEDRWSIIEFLKTI